MSQSGKLLGYFVMDSVILLLRVHALDLMCFSQQEVETFKKLNVISKDEFDTLTPKLPVDPNQEVPPPPPPAG